MVETKLLSAVDKAEDTHMNIVESNPTPGFPSTEGVLWSADGDHVFQTWRISYTPRFPPLKEIVAFVSSSSEGISVT